MVAAKNVNTNHSSQKGLPALLSASIAGLLLSITTQAQAENDGIALHGFADVGFSAQTVESPDNKGFNVGSLDFYLTPQFGDNVRSLIEIIFETLPDGSLATDLERVQMGYAFSDSATVWAGRFHSPYGYWNTAFHHGAQIQTSILRPRFIDFEDKGGILPAHMVGMWATGKIKAGGGKFTYDVYAGNGPQLDMSEATITNPGAGVLTINTAGDNNHQAMVGINLGYDFSGSMDGLRLSIHTLSGDVDELNDVNPPVNNTELSMAGGTIEYLGNDWEVLGEYYSFNNKDKSGTSGSHSSWADFLQIGKNFNGLTPYVRAEKAVLDQADNYFSNQASGQSYTRQSLGLKYDLNPKASLKLELLNSKFEADATHGAGSSYRSMLAQYAIRF